ncbi:hypothetical protein GSI_06494 [Ganoderma sinense ZZ0214-1]|uniref:Uncharacterized protein n=1 Tax=Ganoderma sinense ZZ0214-1 TaxID=1077348 RepID=A0A2G8SDE7_9APHY|nr:hypothetical protein GSI_06494 [Ganoderma sinense ZZ0214-1]
MPYYLPTPIYVLLEDSWGSKDYLRQLFVRPLHVFSPVSGTTFASWVTDVGPPIHAPPDFDLAACVNAAAEVELPDGMQEFLDEDDAVLAAFQGDTFMTAGSPQSLDDIVMIPPLPVFEDPPATIEVTSKHQLHAREHSKKRRRAAAAKHQEPSGTKRELKAAAKRHRNAAIPLHTPTDTLSALEHATDTDGMLAADDAATMANAANASHPIVTNFSLKMENVHVASTAFQGQRYRQTASDREPKPLGQLLEDGFDIIQWTGFDARPIVDRDDTLFAALGGRPYDKDPSSGEVPWTKVQRRMCKIFEYLRENLRVNRSQVEHRRGSFPAVAVGISFGGGQQRVGNLAHTPHNTAVLNTALQSTTMQRVANFANTSMQLFAPKLHKFYGETLDVICDKDPGLKRNFKNNVLIKLKWGQRASRRLALDLRQVLWTFRRCERVLRLWGRIVSAMMGHENGVIYDSPVDTKRSNVINNLRIVGMGEDVNNTTRPMTDHPKHEKLAWAGSTLTPNV